MNSAQMQYLRSSRASLQVSLDRDSHDQEYRKHLEFRLRDCNARIAAAVLWPEDLAEYIVEGYRQFSRSGTLNFQYRHRETVTRVTEFGDAQYFTPLESKILQALQEAYGDSLVVEVLEAHLKRLDGTTEIYHHYTAHVFHKDFYPKGKYQPKLDWESSLYGGSRLEEFCIHGSGIEESLLKQVRSFGVNNRRIDFLLGDILGEAEVSPDGVRNIPTWVATRTYEVPGYSKAPSFGRKVGFDSALLLTDGVVVDLKEHGRYRVWFDYAQYVDEDCWMTKEPSGERALRIQRTEDRTTTRRLQKYGFCYMRGKGTSSQASGVVPFMCQSPYCLMSFHVDGGSQRLTVMVDLDEKGEIVRAWVEASH